MSITPPPVETRSWRGFRSLLLATTISVFVLIVLGGLLRATASGGGCPDWPTCFGVVTPPAGQEAMLDYLHRLATLVSVLLLGSVSFLAWKRYRRQALMLYPVLSAAALVTVQVGLGAFVSQSTGSAWIGAAHLGLSLIVLGSLLVALTAVYYFGSQKIEGFRLSFRSPFARLSLSALLLIFLSLVSGAVVAGSGSTKLCDAWPLVRR